MNQKNKEINLFGNTPMPKNEQNNNTDKKYNLFKNEVNKNQPIKINKEINLFANEPYQDKEQNNNNNNNNSNLLKGEENINKINKKKAKYKLKNSEIIFQEQKNNNHNINDNNGMNNNEINFKENNIGKKTQVIKKKKNNFLKESINLNQMDNDNQNNYINNNLNKNIENGNIKFNEIIKDNKINIQNNENNNINNYQNNNINDNQNNNKSNKIDNNLHKDDNNIINDNQYNSIFQNNFSNNRQALNKDDEKEGKKEDNKINFNEQKCINEDNIKIKEIIKKKQKEEIIKKRKEDEEKRSQIRDLFKCYICYNQLQNPRMCKFCKKMACEQCLKMWFQTKKSCGFCRAKIVFMDTIKVPFDNDFSSYFMDKVEKQSIISNEMDYNVINSQNKGILDNEYSPDGSKDYNYEDYKIDICIEHKTKYEYFCVQCNKNYCSKCLVFFNDSTKKHENHLILPLNESTKNESVNEYKKLNITKENIDKLINLCNLKIKELYCEKKQNIKFFDLIKNNLDNKYYNCLKYFKNKNNEMKLKEEECTRAIETTFNALNNIIKLKDYGQGQQIYEHIKGLIGYSQNIREIEFKLKNFFIESFISQQFEFELAKEGDFVKGFEVYRNNLNNFIPNNDCKVLFIYKNKNIIINIIIKKREKNDNDKKIKYYGYIIFQKKNECEMMETEQSYSPYDEHILNIKCDSNNFISFKDENNKIRFKIYILKHENK